MGTPLRPLPVKLIVGMIFRDLRCCETASGILTKRFGPVDTFSPVLVFDQTDYYEKEMGPELKRRFLSFSRLVPAHRLPSIKVFANKLEKKLSPGKKGRWVNLDPGYITPSKLVLATTKNFSHRLYIKDGIFEEVTLRFEERSFRPFPWTYPDYRTQPYLDFFGAVRERYLEQLKEKYDKTQLYRCV
jgi:hypothetical protein